MCRLGCAQVAARNVTPQARSVRLPSALIPVPSPRSSRKGRVVPNPRVIRGGLPGILLLLLALAGAARADEKFPPALVRCREAEKNPVFKAAGPGHWDVRIRERGWELGVNDVVEGICSVGIPVRDRGGTVIAAISISGLPAHILVDDKPRHLAILQRRARELELRLG